MNVGPGRYGWGITAYLCLTVILAIGGCSSQEESPREVIRPVRTMVVAAGGESRTRTFPGTVEASKRVELAFQVPGVLVNLPVKEGDAVAKGDLIAQLRTDEFQARLDSLQGQLDQARATLQALQAGERPEERRRREAQVRAAEARLVNARSDLDRAERLLTSRAVSRADYEQYETRFRIAEEDLNAAREQLDAGRIGREEDILANEAQVRGLEGRVVEAKIQLQDTTLNAPCNGVIAQRFVEQGQNIMAKQPIVRFQDVEEIEIVVDIPETVMASEIRRSDIVELLAEVTGAPGLQFPVQIREVAQVADPTTQTFKVTTVMGAPEGIRVLPGMTATVAVTYRRADILGDPLLVPISAVFKDPSGEQVAWVIGPDQAAKRRPVTIGNVTGGRVEIVEGLQSGDRIAVAGATHLREGMRVRALDDAFGGDSAGGTAR